MLLSVKEFRKRLNINCIQNYYPHYAGLNSNSHPKTFTGYWKRLSKYSNAQGTAWRQILYSKDGRQPADSKEFKFYHTLYLH